ncbi:E1 ubiquitin-activating protein aos1 [Dipsacomyces acuminosporus]|nr:E1 ubiquitin-activating protein aos1 [Dipsacomyces acuminosporus]
MADTAKAISKEEIALYDRQIRLWGMEAQGRLRNSSIFIIGVKAVTLEACKNLVLAGIGRLVLQDPNPITEDDLDCQYYFRTEDIGKARDQTLAERLRILNPLVQVTASEGKEEYSDFDLVVCIGKDFEYTTKVNQLCRASGEHGVKFVSADAFGIFGYIFADCLGKHQYLEEVKVTDADSANAETKREARVAEYKSMKDSLGHKFSVSNPRRLSRVLSPLVIVYQALYGLTAKENSVVTEESLRAAVDADSKARGIPDGWIADDLIRRVVASWGTEFVPCAAVVGGTLTQEILKIVTLKDMPMNNWFIYDAINGDGFTSTV